MSANSSSTGGLDLVACPNDDDPRCARYIRTRTFKWFDGGTGTNNYCPYCGAELIDA